MKGKRLIFNSPRKVDIQSFDISKPNDLQILTKTEYTLISPGTELASFNALPNTSAVFPKIVGYSNVGRVIEVGEKIENIKIGDKIASHGTHGSHSIIEATIQPLRKVGETIDPTREIGKQQVLTLAKQIPKEANSKHATFGSLGTVCLQAIRKARIELGESVLIIGLGIVGNLALQLAKLDGGYPVIGTDLIEKRLKLSAITGADETINASTHNIEDSIKSMTNENGANIVIETTGSPDPINTAFQSAAWHGRIVLLGSTRGNTKEVNFYKDVHKKGLTILGAHNSVRPIHETSAGFWTLTDDMKLILELIQNYRLNIEPLITDTFHFSEGSKAFESLNENKNNLGIIINWD